MYRYTTGISQYVIAAKGHDGSLREGYTIWQCQAESQCQMNRQERHVVCWTHGPAHIYTATSSPRWLTKHRHIQKLELLDWSPKWQKTRPKVGRRGSAPTGGNAHEKNLKCMYWVLGVTFVSFTAQLCIHNWRWGGSCRILPTPSPLALPPGKLFLQCSEPSFKMLLLSRQENVTL